MKNKSIAMILLILLVAVSMMSSAFAATSQTEAKVFFVEGDLEFETEDLGDDMNNMDIDFGSREVPTSEISYAAVDGAHTLRILDARTNAGNWSVTVQMGKFVNADDISNDFSALITLQNPAKDLNTNDPSVLSAQNPVEIRSDMGAVPVVSVGQSVNRGVFDTTWAQNDTILTVDDSAIPVIEVDAQYTVTMTWTLTAA